VFFFDYNGAQEVKDKYGDWSFAGGRIRGIDNSLVNIEVANKGGDSEPLNSGLIEKGRIGLNAFIHSSFNQSTNEEYKLKHTNEVARLRSHLLSLLK
jgi:hypothetical protein